MTHYPISIKLYGSNALLLEWPEEVSESILKNILQFEQHLSQKLSKSFELIVAYNSLTLIDVAGTTDLKALSNDVKIWYKEMTPGLKLRRFLWKLPVCYDEVFGIDLPYVSKELNFAPEEVVRLHTSQSFTVYGIGFLPGFMYLGGLPDGLQLPRRKEPRMKVAKGAVGLAGLQTGIYPQESPGGWHIIGSCPIPMFNIENKKPCFINVGDKIQFEAITKAEHGLHKIEGEVGIFEPLKEEWDA
ncbi:5-oxoprolinase subunit PxpB [Allomuricauda sp. d1]|uniref:5-oxoprolinase subunit PxpB n=1 Tax=Allomuricauda sp. d1 TaxID=3136725 RepID=UPI0031CE0CB7